MSNHNNVMNTGHYDLIFFLSFSHISHFTNFFSLQVMRSNYSMKDQEKCFRYLLEILPVNIVKNKI